MQLLAARDMLIKCVKACSWETMFDNCSQLASLADVYVNDAFGTAHRAHASTEGVAKHLSPCVGGFLMQKELDYLMSAVQTPNRPFCAIVGGSKVSTKIGVLEELLKKCDILILG